jgi:hypothetical protein
MFKLSNLTHAVSKFAELTDELCKKILRDPKLKVILDDKGLLDKFNKSMPEQSLVELKNEHMRNLRILLKEMSPVEDPELKQLLDDYGNIKLSESFIDYLTEKYLSTEFGTGKTELDIDDIEFLLSEFTLKSLVELAVASGGKAQASPKLKDILIYYRDVVKSPEDKRYALDLARAIQMIGVEMGNVALFITSMTDTTNESKYREALSIRDSEDFDFLDDDDFDIDAAFRQAEGKLSSSVQEDADKSYEISKMPEQGTITPEDLAYMDALKTLKKTKGTTTGEESTSVDNLVYNSPNN